MPPMQISFLPWDVFSVERSAVLGWLENRPYGREVKQAFPGEMSRKNAGALFRDKCTGNVAASIGFYRPQCGLLQRANEGFC
jgi:hypothetical protein